MISNLTKLELKVKDAAAGIEKVFGFLCDADSSVSMVKEALFQMQKYVGQVEDNIRAQQDAAKAQDEQKQPPAEVVEDNEVK